MILETQAFDSKKIDFTNETQKAHNEKSCRYGFYFWDRCPKHANPLVYLIIAFWLNFSTS